jgi:hypothetical protein
MKLKIIFTAILATFFILSYSQKKVGIIGLDTSHAIAFTKELNGDNKKEQYKDFRIVAAYPYGSKTIESSYNRIPGYIEQVEALGVEVVSSIAELLEKVDYVLLETNDGNEHLQQAYEVFKSRKLVFIDKPLAATLSQAIAINQLAKKYNASYFSSSAVRFASLNQEFRKGESGKILGDLDYINPEWLINGTGNMYKNGIDPESIRKEPDLFNQREIFPGESKRSAENHEDTSLNNQEVSTQHTENKQVASVSKPEKKITQIIIYYNDNTFERFNPY